MLSFQSWLLVRVFTITFTSSKVAPWRNQLFHEKINLFTNSNNLNDLKTTFKIKRIHYSYLGLKILGKQWLYLLGLQIPYLLVFQASKKKIRAEKWFFPFADSEVTIYMSSLARVWLGRPGHGSTHRVDRVSPVFFFCWSFA